MSYEYLIKATPLPTVEQLEKDSVFAGYIKQSAGADYLSVSTPELAEVTRKWGGEVYLEWKLEENLLLLTINSTNPKRTLANLVKVIEKSCTLLEIEEI